MISILLIEDDKELCSEIKHKAEAFPDLEIIAEIDNEQDALEAVRQNCADALILDLELNPGSGVTLLENMQRLKINKLFIVVITHVISKTIYNSVRNLGADYICVKYAGYDPNEALSIIDIAARVGGLGEQKKKMSIEDRIKFHLQDMGFSLEISGAKHLCDAIIIQHANPYAKAKDIYIQIAEKADISPEAVEKNIRMSIEGVWDKNNHRALKKKYRFRWDRKVGRPSNLEFIKNVTEMIRKEK